MMNIDRRAKPRKMAVASHDRSLPKKVDAMAMPAKRAEQTIPRISVLVGCASVRASDDGRSRMRLRASQPMISDIAANQMIHPNAVLNEYLGSIGGEPNIGEPN